jgi:AmiR/NasT family two-component response regulator
VALDLVMLERGLAAEEAYELIRRDAEQSGRDLHSVASDVIDLGTSRLTR